ncbi:hypothetical protein E2C01_087994 [Portunus trituberculatus]|uniref:Uncharacterized protein n=1 Tax=Portunus trituberculatus TaxID=210409 RepID=A0A5B7J4Z0_PORTR|nr:hypothetical protein [Portunus trituberculatus]
MNRGAPVIPFVITFISVYRNYRFDNNSAANAPRPSHTRKATPPAGANGAATTRPPSPSHPPIPAALPHRRAGAPCFLLSDNTKDMIIYTTVTYPALTFTSNFVLFILWRSAYGGERGIG